jgi:MFS family permease
MQRFLPSVERADPWARFARTLFAFFGPRGVYPLVKVHCPLLTGETYAEAGEYPPRNSIVWYTLGRWLTLGMYTLPRLSGLSDRIGRKPIFLIFIIGDMLGIMTMVCTLRFWRSSSYHWLIATYITAGMFGSSVLINVLVSSYVSDCVSPHHRTRAMGYVMACTLIGKAVGPFIASQILQHWALTNTFYFALTFDVMALIWLIIMPESSTRETRDRATDAFLVKQAENDQQGVLRLWFGRLNILKPLMSIWKIARGQSQLVQRDILVLVSIDVIYEMIIGGRAGIAIMYPEVSVKICWWTTRPTMNVATFFYSSGVIC